jgi:hypothetical protein
MEEQTWPSVRYGPDGAHAVFNSPDEVPKGWEDHPSKVKPPKDPFDHDGDGKPGGSRRKRKA